MIENRIYKLRTRFNPAIEGMDCEEHRDKAFEKKLEILCLEYNVDIDYE